MILLALRDYLRARRLVKITELEAVFDRDAAVLKGMLAYFIDRGQLRCIQQDATCTLGCRGCDLKPAAEPDEIYVWS
jgi:hypothetical protein